MMKQTKRLTSSNPLFIHGHAGNPNWTAPRVAAESLHVVQIKTIQY
jgi:hypothetical protein